MKHQKIHSNRQQDPFVTSVTEPLWTVDDVANYLRLKQETVRMLARTNKIPALKVGKVWRFHGTDIKTWVQVQKGEDFA